MKLKRLPFNDKYCSHSFKGVLDVNLNMIVPVWTLFSGWVPGQLVLDLDSLGWLWTSSYLETIIKLRMKSHPNTGCSSLSLEGICNSFNHFSSYSQSLHSSNCISLGILWISLLNHHWMFTLCSLHHTFRELHLSDFCKKFKPTNYDVIIIISWFEECSWRFVGSEEKNHIVRFGAILLLPTQPLPCSFTFSFSGSLLVVICCLPKAYVPAMWHSPSRMAPRISCRVLHTCFDFLFSIPLSFVNSASISLLTRMPFWANCQSRYPGVPGRRASGCKLGQSAIIFQCLNSCTLKGAPLRCSCSFPF